MSKQLTVARAASERTVGEWQARSESKEAAVLTAKTNEIAGLQEQHARCGQPVASTVPEHGLTNELAWNIPHTVQAVKFSRSGQVTHTNSASQWLACMTLTAYVADDRARTCTGSERSRMPGTGVRWRRP